MLPWLIAISLFWPLAALYLGGAAIHFEGGGGLRQAGGLLVSFTLFMVAWVLLRMAAEGPLGTILGLIAATLVACFLIPFLCKLCFRALGVRIARGAAHH